MIISKKYKFVYIKTRKTAGTSIEELLRVSLGPDDNFVSKKQLLPGGATFGVEMASRSPQTVSAHMSAEEIQRIVEPSFWSTAFRFTSERHPYEKAVSLAFFNYAMRKERGKSMLPEFSKFLDRTVSSKKYRSFDLYSIGGDVVVHDFIRYDTLAQDVTRICERLGIPVSSELPVTNAVYRTDRRPAREILTEEQKRFVFDACRKEFDLFGYES